MYGKKAVSLTLALWLWLTPAYSAAVIIDQVTTPEKVVAITIEDVDNEAQMEEILVLLSREKAKATFFISARAAAGLPLHRAAEAGHEFGNHSMKHGYWGAVSETEIGKDLAEAAEVIRQATGRSPQLVRPPYDWYGDGFFRAVAALPQPVTVVRGTETGDWTADSADVMLQAAKQAARPGAIININMRFKAAAKALPLILQQLRSDGYSIVTVSELIKKEKPAEPPKPPLPVEPPKLAEPQKAIEPPKTADTPKAVRTIPFGVLHQVPVNGPYVALTFDDGGSSWQVRRILDILREANVKATFFLLGDWASANPELVREMAAEGHEIANHSYSHPSFAWLSEDEMRAEIGSAQRMLSDIAGKPVRLFRPPYGYYNSELVDVVRDMGFDALVLWDVDTRDWTGAAAGTIAYRVETEVSSGSVVLFHLHGSHTAEALTDIIPNLKERGYILTTVGEMLGK